MLGYGCAPPHPGLGYNFQEKNALTLKSLLKCRLEAFALTFSMNIVSLLDSIIFKAVLYVVKTLYNKLCDPISAFHPVCGVLQAAVPSHGFYSVGLCSDVWSSGQWGNENQPWT